MEESIMNNVPSEAFGSSLDKLENNIMDSAAEVSEEYKEKLNDLSTARDSVLDHTPFDNFSRFNKRKPMKREYKIGRNDPCPCGSGKKYKNCCMASGKYEGYEEVD